MRPAGRHPWWVSVCCVMMLVGCLVLPTCPGTPRASATIMFPDALTTQVLSGTATAPASTTGPTGTDTTSPGTATGAGAATNAHADAAGADAARGDAVVLAGTLDEGDYTALAQAVSEHVAPHVGGGAYATALVDTLGARGLVRVAAHLPIGTTTWTSLLATATSSPLWDEGHREALARDLASLVTTTGDVAEADTLLLPLGFRRLLTADQDPLTTAATGTQASGAGGGQSGSGQIPGTTSPDQVPGVGSTATPGPGGGQAATQAPGAGDSQAPGAEDQAPGAGSGRSGSRDPLALDPKFLAALVRGLMAGETGATTGGLRVGWVEYARLTTTAGGGYANFPEGTPREVRARYLLYDPLAAVLTAAARRPQTVLDVLAPLLPGADPSTLGPSGKGRRPNGVDVYGGTAAPGPSGRNYGNQPSLWVDGSLWEWVSARAQGSGPACLEALTAAVASASILRYQATTPQPNPYEAQATWLTEQATITLADVGTTAWTPPARRAAAVMLANSMGDIDNVANAYNYNDLEDSFSGSLPKGWRRTQGIALRILLSEVLRDDTALAVVSWAAEVFITHRLATDAFKVPPGTTVRNASYYYVRYVSVRDARLYGYVYGAIGRGVDGESSAAGVVLAALDRGLDLHDLYHTLLLVMDRTRLLPDEAYLEPPDPFEDETDDQPPRPWNADWMYQDDQGHWHLDPDRAGDDPDGFRTWTTTHPVMAATTAGRYSIGIRYDQGVSAQGRPPARHGPGIPPGQAVLALLLTAATARLVYGYSHTYQRRAQQHWQHRRARRRRRQERHRHQH